MGQGEREADGHEDLPKTDAQILEDDDFLVLSESYMNQISSPRHDSYDRHS